MDFNRQSSSDPFSSSIPTTLDSITGSQLLSSIRPQLPLQTGHPTLDLLLNKRPLKRKYDPTVPTSVPLAGLSRRDHLQLEGPPGVGKTKLAVGLAVRARAASLVSKRVDELEVLYIDADGSASAWLLKLSAESLVAELEEHEDDKSDLIDKICDGIHLVRITSTAELAIFFHRLPHWLGEHSKTKLIILDSLTAHTRYVSMTIEERALVGQYIREGIKLATSSFNCAVSPRTIEKGHIFIPILNKGVNVILFINGQVVVAIQPVGKKDGSDQMLMIIPSFRSGSGWSSSTSILRVQMFFEPDGTRKAVVLEQDPSSTSTGRMKGAVPFDINVCNL
ncbi:hypothetical protein CROQUDRAFT_69154 [Cronartium quercuum f. sp. fusiforme G11]|uniref:Uncharacterized protein n=1 Tax=Cronartium quercuum f. sp. fusiforme G11 TaxID=708437 RepID=A0A9P6NAB2_9BASI|nr:hypothetical protein CROQUDRAFT_69154 [Cronartium quercuum f. sp. fusiforme G11]